MPPKSDAADKFRELYPTYESLENAIKKAGSISSLRLLIGVGTETVRRHRQKLREEYEQLSNPPIPKAEIAPTFKNAVDRVREDETIERFGKIHTWKFDVEHYERTNELVKTEYLGESASKTYEQIISWRAAI